jgi:DNA-binding SARP family transcriptional activator/tetratricopeptide (TPR) repeat protein
MMLKVRLLGQFDIQLKDVPIEVPTRSAQSLLAYLLLNAGTAHRRVKLAGLFWPDTSESNARNNLRHALWRIRKAIGHEHLLTDNVSVALDTASDCWLDAAVLETAVDEDGAADELIDIVAVYTGELLPGFYDDWVVLERERLKAIFEQQIKRLLDRLVQERRWDDLLHWGEHWIAQGQSPEPAYRALMVAHAQLGNQASVAAVYQRCVETLREDLDVEPSQETRALYERLSRGDKLFQISIDAAKQERVTHLVDRSDLPAHPPAFLDDEIQPLEIEESVFVERESELSQLHEFLLNALDGRGQVAFITGGAGRGKTSLANEFARRAQTTHPDLVVASGHCTAYAGVGDPYLPFRDVMDMLAGAVEAKWTAGAITREHATRLWHFLPHTVQALVEAGPDLIDIFVPGAALVGRVTMAIGGESAWLARLKELVARKQGGPVDLEQSYLFEQYVQVLQSLAARQPLLITLDDLQWADVASISLLFHLGRRLDGSRILIVGIYRPDEVAQGWEGGRHPLEKVLGEFKRTFGEIWIDLAEVEETEGRRFVDSLLDTEANGLDEAFRWALFRQTGGHPLFTIELLRTMQARGNLVQDEVWGWVEGSALDWGVLPARVEGAIEERIGRLEAELREILTVASVEGESFTSEVIAQVQGLDRRGLLGLLSQELGKRHRLVRELEEVKAGQQLLSRYQFAHILFQRYLYDSLGTGERRLLHSEIARALEALYAGHTDEIAPQLSYQFCEAGERDKAIEYARQAARRAQAAYAYDEASQHLQTALDLIATGDWVETQMALLEELADVHVRVEQQTQALFLYQAALDRWSSLPGADAMIAVRLHRKILHRVTGMKWSVAYEQFEATAETRAASQDYLESYLILSEAEPPQLERVRVLTVLANIDHGTRLPSALDRAERYAQEAVDLAEQLDAPEELAEALQALADVCFERGESSAHLTVSRRLLALSRDPRFGNLRRRIGILNGLADALMSVGEYAQAIAYLVEVERLVSQNPALGPPLWTLVGQALCWLRLDRWDQLSKVDKKRQDLEKRYSREQFGGSYCAELAVAAAGLALQGDFDQARVLREQAYAVMVQQDGGSTESWGRTQYY